MMNTLKKKNQLWVGGLALALTMGLTACQPAAEEAVVEEPVAEETATTTTEAPVADEAETVKVVTTEETVVEPELPSVAEQTVAQVNDPNQTEINYSCHPALAVKAVYDDVAGQVSLDIADKQLTLVNTNSGENPEVFTVDQSLNSDSGETQWRVAHAERSTGVLRTSDGNEKVDTYECEAGGMS